MLQLNFSDLLEVWQKAQSPHSNQQQQQQPKKATIKISGKDMVLCPFSLFSPLSPMLILSTLLCILKYDLNADDL
jgi:hypothetical protein